eukprot:GFYU01034284.1.p1 GENE.GFYU01034284.1~~GFYU01034284.1.p1  ORF type:complete len:198 (+),score=18.01 GFYU01034284.1:73-666(+)
MSRQEFRHLLDKDASRHPNVRFRRIQPPDLPAVQELHIECFPVTYSNAFYNALLRDDRISVVGLEDEKIVAVASARIDRDEDGCLCPSDSAYMMTFGVTESYRKQGLGSSLLKHLINVAKEGPFYCSRVTLHVKTDNSSALQFYQRNDFSIVCVMTDYYNIHGDQFDAFRLVHCIKDAPKMNAMWRFFQCFCDVWST